jgi:hypothetical protein
MGAQPLVLPRTVDVVQAARIGLDDVEPVVELRPGRRRGKPCPIGVEAGDDVAERPQHRRRVVQRTILSLELVPAAPGRK